MGNLSHEVKLKTLQKCILASTLIHKLFANTDNDTRLSLQINFVQLQVITLDYDKRQSGHDIIV